MKLFRFLAEKAKAIIEKIKEREHRLEEERKRKAFADLLRGIIERVHAECGPLCSEAELQGLWDAYAGPRTDGTIEILLEKAGRISFTDPPPRSGQDVLVSQFLKDKYALLP
jgi:hypothetical protein